ncbi:probable ubiquitin receptor RAD23 isoform X2 [Miscanthus floridulus]|uniref:probable ubiquitin receptor RAD23 isoform X2 n=1 Tax=Miscanthus floridulus TaxID=154761 RepID=UPI00345B1426
MAYSIRENPAWSLLYMADQAQSKEIAPDSAPDPTATSGPAPTAAAIAPDPTATSDPASTVASIGNLEATVQSILEMGGGAWDQGTVVRALQAAYNNLERTVEYLYSGVSEQVEFPAALAAPPASGQLVDPVQAPQSAQPAIPSSVPNANTLDPFPQVLSLPSSSSHCFKLMSNSIHRPFKCFFK